MRIQHNIAALNSYRNLTGNNNAVSKNLEKLSSGYRINRAGDDAAGLAISEKMRAQITGLNTAQKNAQDGVSLVQTAEGALTEVHSMLNRMVELADQSANGTYDNAVDRANLQKEITSLKSEIDRIADSTNFNGINLLDGSLSTGKLPTITGLDGITKTDVAATAGSTELTITEAGAAAQTNDKFSLTINYTDASGMTKEKTIELTANSATELQDAAGNKYTITAGGATAEEMAKAFLGAINSDSELSSVFSASAQGAKLTLTSKEAGSASKINVNSVKSDYKGNGATVASAAKKGEDAKVTYNFDTFKVGDVFTINGQKFAFATADQVAAGKFDKDVNIVTTTQTNNPDAAAVGAMADVISNKLGLPDPMVSDNGQSITFASSPNNGGLTLQIGDTSADFNQMTVSVGDMHGAALGIADIDISTQAGAKAAVDKIKEAINSVSSTRGDLGAIQNRLEHTINNLSVTAENMTAAESRIRDVDMANEMMAYTKNNILVQSSQAMLAQANQIPQGVLQLLQ